MQILAAASKASRRKRSPVIARHGFGTRISFPPWARNVWPGLPGQAYGTNRYHSRSRNFVFQEVEMNCLTRRKAPWFRVKACRIRSRGLSLEQLEPRELLSGSPYTISPWGVVPPPNAGEVIRWDNIALQAHITDTTPFGLTDPGAGAMAAPGPTAGSRAIAMTMIAVFDAADAITQQYQPYISQNAAPPDANLNAAIAQAGHDALLGLYPAQQPELDTLLAQDLSIIPNGQAKQDGIAAGQAAAAAILANRANDGSAAALTASYTVNTAPGNWQPDPLHPTQKAYAPGWGTVTPFGILSATQFAAPQEPALTSQAYTAAYDQVESIGALFSTTRTADQTQIGIFWADESAGVGTPTVIYNMAVQTLAIQKQNTLMQEARLFALANIGIADSAIGSWYSKYADNFWRPITGIRLANETGNSHTIEDPYWQPLGSPADNPVYSGGATNFTPPWPSYVSGHGDLGTAAFQILADFYGTKNIGFTLHSPEYNGITQDETGVVRPELTRSYTNIMQAINENGESRVYLGDHWQFDVSAAITMAVSIGTYDFQHLLQPIENGNPSLVDQGFLGSMARAEDLSGLAFQPSQLTSGTSSTLMVPNVLAIPNVADMAVLDNHVDGVFASSSKFLADDRAPMAVHTSMAGSVDFGTFPGESDLGMGDNISQCSWID
jgi:hypothetical protein